MESVIIDTSIYCSACGKTFRPSEGCDDPTGNKKVTCNVCQAELDVLRLKEHICFHIPCKTNRNRPKRGKAGLAREKDDDIKRDSSSETDICMFCSKEIPLNRLEEHENAHREEEKHRAKQHRIHIPKEGDTICTICGASVTCKDLKKHERTHRRLGTVICSICGFAAKNIYQHMVTHSEERRYSCQECGLAFKHKKNLDAHMLVHEAVGKHKCPTCDKAFKTPYNLRVHLRSHQDIKPFPCQYCEKTFTTKQSRDNHMKTHITHNL